MREEVFDLKGAPVKGLDYCAVRHVVMGEEGSECGEVGGEGGGLVWEARVDFGFEVEVGGGVEGGVAGVEG